MQASSGEYVQGQYIHGEMSIFLYVAEHALNYDTKAANNTTSVAAAEMRTFPSLLRLALVLTDTLS